MSYNDFKEKYITELKNRIKDLEEQKSSLEAKKNEYEQELSKMQEILDKGEKKLNYTIELENKKGIKNKIKLWKLKRKGDYYTDWDFYEDSKKINKNIKEINLEKEKIDSEIEEIMNKIKPLKEQEESNDDTLIMESIFKNYPEVRSDVDFIKDAIKISPRFIYYDLTNDEGIYIEALQLLKKNTDDDSSIKMINSIIEEIKNPKVVPIGKYKIPHKFLFEEIRKKFDSIRLCEYLEMDGKLEEIVCEKVEKMYTDSKTSLFCHNPFNHGYIGFDLKEKIFKNGLWHLEGNKNTLNSVVCGPNYGYIFIDFLTHIAFLQRSDEPRAVVFLQIPKDALDESTAIPVFGSDYDKPTNSRGISLSFDSFILPEYVQSFVYSPKNSNEIIYEDNSVKNSDRRKFKFYYKANSTIPIEKDKKITDQKTR